MKNVKKLVISIIVCQAAGIIGSIFTAPAVKGWYASLEKPFFSPPDWIFAPVWTILFLLMGISLYIVWEKGFKENKDAILTFALQLGLNVWWSIIFFGLTFSGIAFAEILIFLTVIILTAMKFYRVSKLAGLLLLPYIIWVAFASILNFSIWRLN